MRGGLTTLPRKPFVTTQPVRQNLSDSSRVSRFLGVLPGLTVGRLESRRPSIRAPEARPAAPVAPLQKGRSLLVGSGWSPLPRPGRGSERRARAVVEPHPSRLRPAGGLRDAGTRQG